MKKILFTFTLLIAFIPFVVNADTDLTIMPIDTNDWGDGTILKSGGKYLLIDVTSASETDLLDFLSDNNINEYDLYLSHYHSDHYGGDNQLTIDGSTSICLMEYLLRYQKVEGATHKISKLYLPDPNICNRYEEDDRTSANGNLCENAYLALFGAAYESGTEVVLLGTRSEEDVHSSFTFGNTTAKVLYIADEIDDLTGISLDKKNTIINNSSLVTMFTNGRTKFLSAGDIEEVTEKKIIDLGIDISADIFKLNHHGIQKGSEISNTLNFINKVKPKYSYLQFKIEGNPWGYDYSTIKQSIDNLSSFSNIYTNQVNGDIRFEIKNDVITPIVEKNSYTVTVNYKDKKDDKILDSRTYQFNGSIYSNELKYHLYDYEKEFAGYTADPNNSIQTSGVLKENVTYNLYYSKPEEDKAGQQSNSTKPAIKNPETSLLFGYELLIPLVLISGITYIVVRKK